MRKKMRAVLNSEADLANDYKKKLWLMRRRP